MSKLPGVRQSGSTGRSREAKLEAKPDDADSEAGHEGPEGAGLVEARPEDGEEEDGGDGGTQEVGDGLDVVEELGLLEAGDDGHPGDADQKQEQDEETTDEQEFPVGGSAAEPGVKSELVGAVRWESGTLSRCRW